MDVRVWEGMNKGWMDERMDVIDGRLDGWMIG